MDENRGAEKHHPFFGFNRAPELEDAGIQTLSIQVCPKKGINPTILLWGWDWDHQTYSIGKGMDP